MEPTREKRRWSQIEELFLAALDVPREDRDAFLEGICKEDELRREVERMLEADQRSEGLLEKPVASLPPLEDPEPDSPVDQTPTQPWVGPPSHSLRQGELLAGRFRIVRFLAAGGMGEVYEAEDLELGERVALKTVRAELTEDDAAMERFRREVQLARRVSHPSVCRCYDIFHHHRGTDETQDAEGVRTSSLTFLSMELLRGETLSQRLKRDGPMTTEEALPLVRQIAEGLAAAHDEGIVHRDLKSANVLLVPSPRGLRAVVTDFGLARLGRGGGTITQSGLTLGTPAYMAPEQVRGEEITTATDVYALGILMYEMITGHFPFESEDSLAMALRRLHEEPSSPRHYVEDLEPRWERTILRCLKRQAAARFVTARDTIRYLDEGIETRPLPRPRFTSRKTLLGILLGLLFLAGAYALWSGLGLGSTPSRDEGKTAEVTSRRSVAVLGFKDLAGRQETRWLSTALAEMLTMELAAGERLRTIPGENIARMKMELALPDRASLAVDTLADIHRYLGTDLVVLGAYLVTGTELRLDVRVEDPVTGTSLALITEMGNEAELLNLVSQIGRRLRNQLGIEAASDGNDLGRALPQAPEAARLYAEGLASLRLFDALGAQQKLADAVALEPAAPLIHAALAAAWTRLGNDAEAANSARRAFELSQDLPRADRQLVEARFHEATGNRQRAAEIYHTLHEVFPDDVEYGLRLAAVQTASGRGDDALSTLEELRTLPGGTDPRLDLAEAEAAKSLSDYRRALEAAERAIQQGQTLGARWMVARAFFEKAWALWRLGELEAGEEACSEAEAMFEDLGDRTGFADALNLRANIVENRGHRDEARKLYEEALAVHRAMGHLEGMSRVLNNLAWVVFNQGDLETAQSYYDESIEIARATDRKDAVARGLHNLALLHKRQGDFPTAQRLFEQALSMAQEIGNRNIESTCLNNLARLLQEQGDSTAALEVFERALTLAREIGDRRGVASRLNNLGILLRQQGELARAHAMFQESANIYRDLGDLRNLGRRLNNLASLQRKRGDLFDARKIYEEVDEIHRQIEDPSGRATWLNGMGTLQMAEDDLEGARKSLEEGIALRRSLGSEHRVLVAQTVLSDLHRAAGRLDEAERLARSITQELETLDRDQEALAAALVLAQTLTDQGRQDEARQVLERSRARVESVDDLELRLRTEWMRKGLVSPEGSAEVLIQGLDQLLQRVEATGLGELALEIRWARAQILVANSNGSEAPSALDRLIEDTKAAGFLALHRRAQALQTKISTAAP